MVERTASPSPSRPGRAWWPRRRAGGRGAGPARRRPRAQPPGLGALGPGRRAHLLGHGHGRDGERGDQRERQATSHLRSRSTGGGGEFLDEQEPPTGGQEVVLDRGQLPGARRPVERGDQPRTVIRLGPTGRPGRSGPIQVIAKFPFRPGLVEQSAQAGPPGEEPSCASRAPSSSTVTTRCAARTSRAALSSADSPTSRTRRRTVAPSGSVHQPAEQTLGGRAALGRTQRANARSPSAATAPATPPNAGTRPSVSVAAERASSLSAHATSARRARPWRRRGWPRRDRPRGTVRPGGGLFDRPPQLIGRHGPSRSVFAVTSRDSSACSARRP